ncbi:hypothetical protein KAM339_035510 [Aeromonas caviae]|uniref:hypothetical protein n=1 Tax=Aeromonas caviae TaxID=648 RepID=UPI001CC4E0D5|nr:hypothetical protein [Aeromonas caviae]BDA15010.1 hypothetical protein KAM339_035510 [Aeromonas caviae]
MQPDDFAVKIKNEMSRIGWSLNDFVMEYDKYHSYKSKLTIDSLKKQLSRKTTNQALLKNYLDFIYQHETWRKLDNIKPLFIDDKLEGGFILEMAKISCEITKTLKKT